MWERTPLPHAQLPAFGERLAATCDRLTQDPGRRAARRTFVPAFMAGAAHPSRGCPRGQACPSVLVLWPDSTDSAGHTVYLPFTHFQAWLSADLPADRERQDIFLLRFLLKSARVHSVAWNTHS